MSSLPPKWLFVSLPEKKIYLSILWWKLPVSFLQTKCFSICFSICFGEITLQNILYDNYIQYGHCLTLRVKILVLSLPQLFFRFSEL